MTRKRSCGIGSPPLLASLAGSTSWRRCIAWVEEFRRTGAEVVVAASPWRLGAAEADLAVEWFNGWILAACEQEPELAADAGLYRRRRLRAARAGRLAVSVGHADLLVLP